MIASSASRSASSCFSCETSSLGDRVRSDKVAHPLEGGMEPNGLDPSKKARPGCLHRDPALAARRGAPSFVGSCPEEVGRPATMVRRADSPGKLHLALRAASRPTVKCLEDSR